MLNDPDDFVGTDNDLARRRAVNYPYSLEELRTIINEMYDRHGNIATSVTNVKTEITGQTRQLTLD